MRGGARSMVDPGGGRDHSAGSSHCQHLSSDTGPEFIADAIQDRPDKASIKDDLHHPGQSVGEWAS